MRSEHGLELGPSGLSINSTITVVFSGDSSLGGWTISILDNATNILLHFAFKRMHGVAAIASRIHGEWSTWEKSNPGVQFPLDQIIELVITAKLGHFVVEVDNMESHTFRHHLPPNNAVLVTFERMNVHCASVLDGNDSCPEPCDFKENCINGVCTAWNKISAQNYCSNMDCGNGICVAGLCKCSAQEYSTTKCPVSTTLCSGVGCGGHGYCIAGNCFCTDQFSGPSCEIPPEPCHSVHCFNKGKCVNGVCVCEERFTGRYCQSALSFCHKNCIHGTCVGSQCLCKTGFTGEACDKPIQDETKCEKIFNSEHGVHEPDGFREGDRFVLTVELRKDPGTVAIRFAGDELDDFPLFLTIDFRDDAPVRGQVVARSKTFGKWSREDVAMTPIGMRPYTRSVLEVGIGFEGFLSFFLDGKMFHSFATKRFPSRHQEHSNFWSNQHLVQSQRTTVQLTRIGVLLEPIWKNKSVSNELKMEAAHSTVHQQ